MAVSSRGGLGGLLATEKLEILWGSRGNPREWALRRKELIDVQNIVSEVRKSLASLKLSLQEIKDDIDDINGQILLLENRLDAFEQDLSDIDTILNGLETRLGNAESALIQLDQDLAAITTELGNVGGDVTALQTDVAHLQTDLTALTARVAANEGDIAALEIDVNNLEADVDELQLGLPSLTVTADLNTAVTNKEFQWSSTSTNIPVPGSYGRGWTVASSANDLTQFGVINSTGQMFVRFRTGGVWSGWSDIVSLRAEPFALQSNPGATPFPAGAYTAIPFYTNTELSGGITKTGTSTFTVAQAGLYQFELEVRTNGGQTNMPPVGTPIGLSIDTTTVPTSLRAGYSAADTVAATTIIRLVCIERLAAGAQRVPYILNQGAAAYQVASAVVKIARLSA